MKNRERAMALLRARLFEMELEKQRAEVAARRKSQVHGTSGARKGAGAQGAGGGRAAGASGLCERVAQPTLGSVGVSVGGGGKPGCPTHTYTPPSVPPS